MDIMFYRGLPDQNPTEIPAAREVILPSIKQAFDSTNFFSNYSFEPSAKDAQDYTIKINIYNHGNQGAAAISGFITGFTFGIIPGAATDNFSLELQAIDKQGSVLSKHANNDAIQTWAGIWFIPMMGHTQEKALTATLENQVRTALKELVESGEIKYSYHRNSTIDQVALNQ